MLKNEDHSVNKELVTSILQYVIAVVVFSNYIRVFVRSCESVCFMW